MSDQNSSIPVPDRSEAERFVEALAGAVDAPLTWQTFDDDETKPVRDKTLSQVRHGTVGDLWPELAALNARGAGIFVMVAEGDGAGRTNENVRQLRAVFADDDAGRLTASTLAVEPSIVVQSKGGLHVYWRVRRGEPLEKFKPAQTALARRLGTDASVKDLARVMRVPGFLHRKDPASPFMVRMVEAHPAIYGVDEVLSGMGADALPPAAPPPAAPPPAPPAPRLREVAPGRRKLDLSGSEAYRRARSAMELRDPASQGARNAAAYSTACYLIDFGITDDEVVDLLGKWNQRNSPPLDDGELAQVIANAREYRAHPVGVRAAVSPTVAAPTTTTDTPDDEPEPVQLLPGARLLDTDFPPIQFAVFPYFPRGEVCELSGAHGIFKSTAALDACLAVATGRPWGGHEVVAGKSCFITMEDSERTLSRRVRAWLEGIQDAAERLRAEQAVRERFSYLAREQTQDLALTVTDHGTTTARPAVVARVAELVEGAVLVVLETTARLHDGPELNEGLSVFARCVERIATGSGAAVVIVRHVSKQAAREQVIDSYAGRGGGALADAARSVCVMTRDRKPEETEDGEADPLAPIRLSHVKATHSSRGPRIVWKPMTTGSGVYLVTVSEAEETRDAAQTLLAVLIEAGEDGITKKALHNGKPGGLGRSAASRAMKLLVETGRAVEVPVTRGDTRQKATVYRAR